MTFAVMLAGKGLATHGTHKWPFVGMGSKVRAEVVRTGEALGAEGALKGSWVFLDSVVLATRCRGARRIGELEDVVAIRDR